MFSTGIYFWVIFAVFIFLFLLGFFYRVSLWLRGGPEKSRIKKFFNYKVLFLQQLFSRNFFRIIRSFFLDGIVHVNLFRDSKLKWFIHIFMFWGLLAFTIISILHLIALAIAPGWIQAHDAGWYISVFGSLENRFTAFVMDFSKLAIFFGAFLAVVRYLFLKNKMKSVELKDKSAGIIISIIAIFGFLYEAAYFSAMETPAIQSAFAPGGFILSYLFKIIKIKWWMFDTIYYAWEMVVVLFSIYMIGLLMFVAFIPYGKYSHMVFGPVVAVYNRFIRSKK
jgi:heterodisulfide reductase subunit E